MDQPPMDLCTADRRWPSSAADLLVLLVALDAVGERRESRLQAGRVLLSGAPCEHPVGAPCHLSPPSNSLLRDPGTAASGPPRPSPPAPTPAALSRPGCTPSPATRIVDGWAEHRPLPPGGFGGDCTAGFAPHMNYSRANLNGFVFCHIFSKAPSWS